ncbi:response regulator [Sphingosinicella rhizophila]|uniref:Response regulator n=1 Tax=Sphingosinicella rhizophila TaxID=3050082 RepID=A0ABU3QAH3_9SPHN|nr:response regulator [Sphingosinicella sp. GR2756]MDT9600408.1 response regulator [Sphingosinicella sp. GR2756]
MSTDVSKVSAVHAFIIEDDYLISRSIQDMLGELGFTSFSFARSEDAAIAGATGEDFDLITVDAHLLPGDGIKAVGAICAGRRDIPVVFVTGYASEILERVPGAVIVEKPVTQTALQTAVFAVLAQREW